jgi:hypothetical protein
MGAEVSLYANNGEMTDLSSYATPKQYMDGITLSLTWTGLTTTEDMNPATYGSFLEQITTPTVEKSTSCRQNLMTYDIAYAGPRNRYTVATDAGPIIVHNCGYGMGAAKFQAQLKTFGVYTELVEAQRIIDVYRETYPKIPELWAQAGEALTAMMRDDTAPIGKDGVLVVDGRDGIRLPNGLYIRYPNLRKQKNEENRFELMYDVKKGRSSVPTRVYGGKAVENLCQALARIIIGEQMLMISRRYKVVMTVHDSVVPVVKNEDLAEALVFIQDCMRMRPRWALGLPLNCEAGYGYNYGEC